MLVEKIRIVVGEFGVVVQDIDKLTRQFVKTHSCGCSTGDTYLDVWAQMRSKTSRSLLNSSGSGSGSVAPGTTVPYWVVSSYSRPSVSDALWQVSKGWMIAGR
jgi:hypothetical protein